ncbi:MAG: hypothetical protein U0704_03535 [Candidatus Eisenbacteria bacterium]
MPKHAHLLSLLALLLAASPGAAAAAPLGHGFTYQGQLQQGGVPVNGTVSLSFSLWDAAGTGTPPGGGTQVGDTQRIANVAVTGGVFSVVLNAGDQFSNDAFNGQARWLQVAVCADSTCAAATVLGPRQLLTGAPYALGPWQLVGANVNYSQGNVGIGTRTPALPLHVKGTGELARVEGASAGTANIAYVGFGKPGGVLSGYVGDASASDDDTYLGSQANNVNIYAGGFVMSAQTNGRVGIGTYSPASALEVRGDVRLGTFGEFFATSSSENLRIVRGEVLAAGSISAGSGFTVTHPATGIYNLVFTTPFGGTSHPAVSITPVANSGAYLAMLSSLPGTSVVALRIVTLTGAAADAAFSFTVIGAR